MMIISAARSMSCDIKSRFSKKLNQTSHKMQTNPQNASCLKSEHHDDRYNEKHRRWFRWRRKVASKQMMILSTARSLSCDVTVIYPSMVNQTSHKKQTKPQYSPWLKSEYHGDRYNENTDIGSVSKEKLHHSR
jgi:hypothetical protein